MNQDVTSYIDAAAENYREILSELRNMIYKVAPDVNEQFKWSRPVYGIDKDFCYLKANKKNVALGFFDFEKVKTNKELIEGTGKSMRHIKLNKVKDITEFKIEKMLKEVLK